MLELLIDWKPYTTVVRGEEISMELKPLNNEAMLALSPIMAKDIDKKDIVGLYLQTFELQKISSGILDKHARKLEGITINGKIPSFKQVAEEAMLAELAVKILSELFVRSTLSKEEEGN